MTTLAEVLAFLRQRDDVITDPNAKSAEWSAAAKDMEAIVGFLVDEGYCTVEDD